MNDLQRMAAEAALRKMAEQGYFSICTIDKIRESLGLGKVGSDAYQTLNLLHCVDYGKMPDELRAALPGLVAEVLQEPAIEFRLDLPARLSVVAKPEPALSPQRRRGLLSWRSS